MAPTNAARYARGEIWWYENFDDVTALSTKIRACELNSAVEGASFSTRLECAMLRVRCRLLLTAKYWAQATVNNYHSLCTALTGPIGEKFDDVTALSTKIRACELNSAVNNYLSLCTALIGKHGVDNSSYPRDAMLARVPAVAPSPCPCL